MKKVLASFAIGVLVMAGCGGDDDGSADGISVSGAWARTSPMASDVGVAYLTIETPVADELIAASAPATVAARTELHETVMAEDAMTDDATGEDGMGVMTMREVQTVELPADTPVAFEPGGLHVMLIGLVEPLEAGDTFDIRLSFAEADPIDVTVEVRDEAP